MYGHTNDVNYEYRGVSSSCPWENDKAVRCTSDILETRSRQIMWGEREIKLMDTVGDRGRL